jgi:hypothetical protein
MSASFQEGVYTDSSCIRATGKRKMRAILCSHDGRKMAGLGLKNINQALEGCGEFQARNLPLAGWPVPSVARSAGASNAVMATGCARQTGMRRGAETSDDQSPSVARNNHFGGPPRDEGPRHFLGLFKAREEHAEDLAIDP